jgi:GTP-binding protein HflX
MEDKNKTKTHQTKQDDPKVLGIAIQRPEQTDAEIEYSMLELKELLKTLGAQLVGTVIQKRDSASRQTYFGTGKMEEAKQMAEELEAEFIVSDDELTALQIKTIEAATGLKVKDRTSIILDIFAAHASTKEGKLQVELAMHQYQLPRLLRMWTHLERQRGGIGMKGPGETQLETDRRMLSNKMKKIKEELDKVTKTRELQGKKRIDRFAPLFSLVGYTNAGKSTLLNALSNSNVMVNDGLFTTLDPTSRRIELCDGYWCIVSDTVGFIRKLPHSLVNAFHATLESVVQSEVLLIVCDISDPSYKEQLIAVDRVLTQIGAQNHERIYVFNKSDRGTVVSQELLDANYPNHVLISALNKTNFDILASKMSEIMRRNRVLVEVTLPVNSSHIGEIMSLGKDVKQNWDENAVKVTAELPKSYMSILENEKIKFEEIN